MSFSQVTSLVKLATDQISLTFSNLISQLLAESRVRGVGRSGMKTSTRTFSDSGNDLLPVLWQALHSFQCFFTAHLCARRSLDLSSFLKRFHHRPLFLLRLSSMNTVIGKICLKYPTAIPLIACLPTAQISSHRLHRLQWNECLVDRRAIPLHW